MKKLITLLVALSLVSPTLYADQTSKKAKQATHISLKKQHKQHITKNKTYTPISKKMMENALNKNNKNLKSKTIAANHTSNKIHKSKAVVANHPSNKINKSKKIVAHRPSSVDKKTVLPTDIQKQESTQLGLNHSENGLEQTQTIPQDKGFFRNAWDQLISYFR